jgi:hypothetical protein
VRARRNVPFRGLSGWAVPVPRHRLPKEAMREGQGGFRGVCRDLRGLRSGAGRCQRRDLRDYSVCRSVGSSLRPPRPSTVTGPGPSRTSPGRRFKMANHPSSALPDRSTLLRSVRTTAGSLAARTDGAEAPPGHRDPASPGVRDLLAPPPTSPARVHFPSTSGCPAVAFGPTAPPVQPCSALVVSHHLDGFLRVQACGLVASRCRSWGSPRFAETRSHGEPW